MEISGIVLAGGKSLRLGQDKVLEVIGDKTLFERVVSRLSFLESDIIIVKAAKQTLPQLNGYPALKIIADTYPHKGPLGGIYTGLVASDSLYNLVVACDMPFLNQALLEYMIGLAINYDLVLPRVGELVEPLHAVYSKACLAPIEELLKRGELQIRKLFNLVRVRYVAAEEIDRFDPEHLSLFNINTVADLEKTRELVGKERSK